MSFVISGECSHSHTAFFLSNHSPWDLSLITFLWQKDSQALKGAGCFRFQVKLVKRATKSFWTKTTLSEENKEKTALPPTECFVI